MLNAMAEHLALLRELGQPVPEPAESVSLTILDPAAAQRRAQLRLVWSTASRMATGVSGPGRADRRRRTVPRARRGR
jgi:hypothetical protein